MVQAIIFDCFGVLTTDRWKEFVATLPEAQCQEARELNRAYGGAHITKDDFRAAIHELTGRQPTDIDQLLDHETTTSKNTQLLDLISQLKSKYKIGLLSNVGSNWIRDRFLTADEQRLFNDFTLSYEVRMTKPDPRIFQLAAKRLEVPIESCLLVDDVEYYGEIASQLGMKFVLYQDFAQTKRDLEKLLADPET